jgi:hypothetical protein
MKGINEDFRTLGFERILSNKKIKTEIENYEKMDTKFKQTHKINSKKIIDSIGNISKYEKKIMELQKQIELEKKTIHTSEHEIEVLTINKNKIYDKIDDIYQKSIEFDQNFKKVYEEDDAYLHIYEKSYSDSSKSLKNILNNLNQKYGSNLKRSDSSKTIKEDDEKRNSFQFYFKDSNGNIKTSLDEDNDISQSSNTSFTDENDLDDNDDYEKILSDVKKENDINYNLDNYRIEEVEFEEEEEEECVNDGSFNSDMNDIMNDFFSKRNSSYD